MDDLPARRPVLLGVTGRIGSGKSTFCRILARRSRCTIIDADALGHAALEEGGAIRADLVTRFGRRILSADAAIDRGLLARIVFADEQALRDLNAIVHPWMIGEILRRLVALRESEEAAIVLLDAAVLLEWKDRLSCDRTILVRCPDEMSIRRLVLRGMAEEEARRRLARQPSEEQMGRMVDFIVDNAGGLEELEEEAARLWTVVRDQWEEKAP